jgi:hypothetical protein
MLPRKNKRTKYYCVFSKKNPDLHLCNLSRMFFNIKKLMQFLETPEDALQRCCQMRRSAMQLKDITFTHKVANLKVIKYPCFSV